MENQPSSTVWRVIVKELGVSALQRASQDAKILILQRFVRLFAFSAVTLILVFFLIQLGNSKEKVGLFMTLTLLGDIALSIFFTLIADRLGRRFVLGIGAVGLIGSGIVFGLFSNFWVLLAGAVLGVISPSAGEVGPFRAIEESILTQLTPLAERSDIFSWCTLIGIVGQALGMAVCGWVTQMLKTKPHWTSLRAYRMVFLGYAVLGFIKLCLTQILSAACEAGDDSKEPQGTGELSETSHLLNGYSKNGEQRKSWLGIQTNRESIIVLAKVSFLQALEAIGYSLVVYSWLSYYFQELGTKEGTRGIIFLMSFVFQGLSNIVASPVSKRLGMTLAIASLAAAMTTAAMSLPISLAVAIIIFMLRSSTNVIGVRTAFISSAILPAERTAFMGMINVVRTLGLSVGPIITGALADKGKFEIAFVLSGIVVATYAIGLWALLYEGGEARTGEMQGVVEDGLNGSDPADA